MVQKNYLQIAHEVNYAQRLVDWLNKRRRRRGLILEFYAPHRL